MCIRWLFIFIHFCDCDPKGVDHFKDIAYNDRMTYGEMRMQEEYEMSVFNLDEASVETHRERFNMADEEAIRMLEARLPLPAYDNLLKASHAFNVLDARGAVARAGRGVGGRRGVESGGLSLFMCFLLCLELGSLATSRRGSA